MKMLNLTLKKQPFDVMVTGEKGIEFRKRSEWILSRLIDKKTNQLKSYTHVKFVNGYGADKPYFIGIFNGFDYAQYNYSLRYSNGLLVNVEQGDIQIFLGEITERGSLLTS